MNGSTLLQRLMAIPEPSAEAEAITLSGEQWEIPIHDAPHVRIAIGQWPRYRFPSPAARKNAANKIVQRAVKLGIVSEGLKLVKA